LKKTLLVVALALLLALVVAAPAFAWQAPATPQPGNAYVIPSDQWFGANDWWEIDANGAATDHRGNVDAIPAEYNVWIAFGWASPIRGTIQNIPFTYLNAFTISDASGNVVWSMPAAVAQSYWSIVYNVGKHPAFNKADATYWERDWYVELPPLAAGSYTGSTVQTYTRIITDSSFAGHNWSKHAQQRPLKVAPGTFTDSFAFTVGS
jgi:hypothetical protein